jgi:hypothetical protein
MKLGAILGFIEIYFEKMATIAKWMPGGSPG